MPESDDNLRLEIGHVLFIDIVGYSKLLNEEKERLCKGVLGPDPDLPQLSRTSE